MIREEVLRSWKDCKEKILNSNKLLEEVNNSLDDMSLVTGDPYQVLKYLKGKLPSIVQDCQKLRNKYISGQFGSISIQPGFTYLIYTNLVVTYQRIIEYYDQWQDQSGPIIYEVD